MRGSLVKVSLILSVALPLSLGALPGQTNQPTAAQQKPPVQETPDHYKLGYEYGKKLIHLLSQPDTAELMNQVVLDKEVLRLTNIINKENPSSEAHKKAFKEYQIYNKGLKEALATYGSLQFISGYKKALQEFNLVEAPLITYKTPKVFF